LKLISLDKEISSRILIPIAVSAWIKAAWHAIKTVQYAHVSAVSPCAPIRCTTFLVIKKLKVFIDS